LHKYLFTKAFILFNSSLLEVSRGNLIVLLKKSR
jgi:hypothetical protein